jgi:glycosyltransferase involved in cell wall biosynthesis
MKNQEVSSILTVGIPTYNRSETLKKVLPRHSIRGVDLLVVNDASTDDTSSYLKQANLSNLYYETNTTRLGFCGNFFKLFKSCKTSYLLISTDDDIIDAQACEKLAEQLKTVPPELAFLSTLFSIDKAIYRGKKSGDMSISLANYRLACNHMPGIVFESNIARSLIQSWESELNFTENCYPQAFLLALLLAHNYEARYTSIEVIKQGFNMPSGISRYASLEGRFKEFLYFRRFYIKMIEANLPAIRELYQTLHQHEESMFRILGMGIREEAGDQVTHLFLESAKKFFRSAESNPPLGSYE